MREGRKRKEEREGERKQGREEGKKEGRKEVRRCQTNLPSATKDHQSLVILVNLQ